jgi:hypothetical protein
MAITKAKSYADFKVVEKVAVHVHPKNVLL